MVLLEVKLSEPDFTHCNGRTSPANQRRDVCESASLFFENPKACYLRRPLPAEVKVLGWRKGERSGMVVRGAGGPGRGDGGGTVRTGGRVPWGAKAEYAYRAGYDGMGRVSVTHVVERGYSARLTQRAVAA